MRRMIQPSKGGIGQVISKLPPMTPSPPRLDSLAEARRVEYEVLYHHRFPKQQRKRQKGSKDERVSSTSARTSRKCDGRLQIDPSQGWILLWGPAKEEENSSPHPDSTKNARNAGEQQPPPDDDDDAGEGDMIVKGNGRGSNENTRGAQPKIGQVKIKETNILHAMISSSGHQIMSSPSGSTRRALVRLVPNRNAELGVQEEHPNENASQPPPPFQKRRYHPPTATTNPRDDTLRCTNPPPGLSLLYQGVHRDLAQRSWSPEDVLVLGPFSVEIIADLSTTQSATTRPRTVAASPLSGPSVTFSRPPLKRLRLTTSTAIFPLRVLPDRNDKKQGPSELPKNRHVAVSKKKETVTIGNSVKVPGVEARKQPPLKIELVRGKTKAAAPSSFSSPRPLLCTSVQVATDQESAQPLASPDPRPAASKSLAHEEPFATKYFQSPPNAASTRNSKNLYAAASLASHSQLANSGSDPCSKAMMTVLGHIPLPASIRTILQPHQVEGVEFLWNSLAPPSSRTSSRPSDESDHPPMNSPRGAILADEMGLGKTLMTIAVVSALHRSHRTKQFIIVCPSSLVTNWAKEFDKWIGQASQPKRVVIRKGDDSGLCELRSYCNSMKQRLVGQTGQVLIVSYDLLRIHIHFFREIQTPFGLLVVDEGHRLKNAKGTQTLTALESLPCDARLCLTATPLQNNLTEFYTLANFVRPGVLGDLPTFRRLYDRPISAANDKHATPAQREHAALQIQELEQVTQSFMLRRHQKDVLTRLLPPRTEALVFCKPSLLQCQLYQQVTEQQSANQYELSGALTSLTDLRKICTHPVLHKGTEGNNTGFALEDSGKLVVVDKLLQSIRDNDPDEKVVIVSNFTSALSLVETLIMAPRGLSFLRLDGSTDIQSRQSLVDTFQSTSADHSFCFLLSAKAGGCGLTLTRSNHLILLDPDWNPATDKQSMARVYRQGQKKPCFLYRLFTTGTLEEVILQRQMQKGNLASATADSAATASELRFSKEELHDCFTLKWDCESDTKKKMGSFWPDYDGPDSLDGTISALYDTANFHNGVVSFIYLMKNQGIISQEECSSADASGLSIVRGCLLGPADAEECLKDVASDEECEFEG